MIYRNLKSERDIFFIRFITLVFYIVLTYNSTYATNVGQMYKLVPTVGKAKQL